VQGLAPHGQLPGLHVPGAASASIHMLAVTPTPRLDVHAIRRDFPILSERVDGPPIV
jgi:hypothetical protein